MSDNPPDPTEDDDSLDQSGDTAGDAERDAGDAAWDALLEGETAAGNGDSLNDAAERNPHATPQIPADDLFEVLASPGNRYVLTYLLRVDNPATYADLVEYVVARVDPPPEYTEATFRGRIAATLVGEVIPRLHTAGLVEVDEVEQQVAATPAIAAAAPHLAVALSALTNPAAE